MFKSIFVRIFVLLIIFSFFITPIFVFAQSSGTGPISTGPIKIDNPFKEDTIEDFIKTIVNDILIPIGAVIAAVMVIYAGFLFVTAGGDTAQITKAKDALLWAVIGAAILLGAWVITNAISATIDELKKVPTN